MKTPDEVRRDYEALSSIAARHGVTASTMAQFVDMAGSYSSLTTHESGVPRRLPPRASLDGIMLASKVSQAIGTPNARSIVVRYRKLEETNDRSDGSVSSSGTNGQQ